MPEIAENARPQPTGHFRRNCGSEPAPVTPNPTPASSRLLRPPPALCQAELYQPEIVELGFLVPPGFPFFQARLAEIPEAAILNKQPGL